MSPQTLQRIARFFAGACFVISCLVFVGWQFQIDAFLRVLPGWVTLRPYGALTFFFESIALWLLVGDGRQQRSLSYRFGIAFGSVAAVLGLISTLEYTFGFSLGMDQLLFPTALSLAKTPGRIAPNAAVSHFLISVAIVFLDYRTRTGRAPAQILALIVFAINLLAVTGYAYGIEKLYGGLAIYTKIAFHAAFMLLLLPLGVLFARPEDGLMKLVVGKNAGSLTARILLPLVILVPFLFGWVSVAGSDAGFYDRTFALMLVVVGTISFFSVTIGWSAHALNRLDEVRRQAQEQTDRERRAVSHLESERDVREKFTNALTHDLRTPLSAAKMAAQMALRYRENAEKRDSLLLKVTECIERTDKMINDLLDANRIKAGETLPLKLEVCNLGEIVEKTFEELSLSFGERFKFHTQGDCIGQWDTRGIRRIVENLATNAVKYGNPATPVTGTVVCDESFVILKVHNQGGELSAEDSRALFEMFHRTKSAKDSGQSGWGIGLTLVKGIAASHGGRVWVESGQGQGTTFFVELPRGPGDIKTSHPH